MKEYVYVILARVQDNTGEVSDVLGVYDNEEQARIAAKAEIDERYIKDIEEGELVFQEKFEDWYRYHSDRDFYEVDVWVLRKELNNIDIKLSNMAIY